MYHIMYLVIHFILWENNFHENIYMNDCYIWVFQKFVDNYIKSKLLGLLLNYKL